jgi:hypothetical protein
MPIGSATPAVVTDKVLAETVVVDVARPVSVVSSVEVSVVRALTVFVNTFSTERLVKLTVVVEVTMLTEDVDVAMTVEEVEEVDVKEVVVDVEVVTVDPAAGTVRVVVVEVSVGVVVAAIPIFAPAVGLVTSIPRLTRSNGTISR